MKGLNTKEITPHPVFQNLNKVKDNRTDEEVWVYLRKPNKKSWKILIRREIKTIDLMKIIEQKTKIKKEYLIMYLKGKKYEYGAETKNGYLAHISLRQKDILHIHNKLKVEEDQLSISVELYSALKKLITKQFSVFAKQKIKIFIKLLQQTYPQLSNTQVALVQSGRKLDESKTFEQQDIEDGSSFTLIVNKKIQKLTEKNSLFKEQVKQFQVNDGIITYPDSSNLPIRKNFSADYDVFFQHLPNFKKKEKNAMLYRPSPKKNALTEQIWESDSSGSDFNKKQLLTALHKKKQRKKTDQYGSFVKKSCDRGEGENFSVLDRFQLKQEIQKLFQSDSLSNSGKSQINRLVPPKIATDEFLEESEQIDFVEGQNEKIKKDEMEWKLPFDLGVDIRGSIGKNKGRSLTQELIPTRDFQIDNIQMKI